VSESKDIILRENEIRPDGLIEDQAKFAAADIRRLIQHKDDFVHVPCPACGGEYAHKNFEKY